MSLNRALILGLAASLAASCNAAGPTSPAPLFTVAELVPRIDELNGKIVRVAGYLDECSGYECDLYPSSDDRAVWDRAVAALTKNKQAPLPDLPVLGIGSGANREFDTLAAPFTHRYVVITGKVDSRCRYRGERGCTDRSPDLEPTAIAAWNGPVPPPPQAKSLKA